MDPLAQLRDWHAPEPVSWWPPAPGWWILGLLLLGLLLLGGMRWLRRWRGDARKRSAAVRAALIELASLRTLLQSGGEPRAFAAGVSALLRRLALTRYPPERVAGLSGSAWMTFLDQTGGGGEFTHGPARALACQPFQTPGECTSSEALATLDALAERWIRAQLRTGPDSSTEAPPSGAREDGGHRG